MPVFFLSEKVFCLWSHHFELPCAESWSENGAYSLPVRSIMEKHAFVYRRLGHFIKLQNKLKITVAGIICKS